MESVVHVKLRAGAPLMPARLTTERADSSNGLPVVGQPRGNPPAAMLEVPDSLTKYIHDNWRRFAGYARFWNQAAGRGAVAIDTVAWILRNPVYCGTSRFGAAAFAKYHHANRGEIVAVNGNKGKLRRKPQEERRGLCGPCGSTTLDQGGPNWSTKSNGS